MQLPSFRIPVWLHRIQRGVSLDDTNSLVSSEVREEANPAARPLDRQGVNPEVALQSED
jgi:hypothetical protein